MNAGDTRRGVKGLASLVAITLLVGCDRLLESETITLEIFPVEVRVAGPKGTNLGDIPVTFSGGDQLVTNKHGRLRVNYQGAIGGVLRIAVRLPDNLRADSPTAQEFALERQPDGAPTPIRFVVLTTPEFEPAPLSPPDEQARYVVVVDTRCPKQRVEVAGEPLGRTDEDGYLEQTFTRASGGTVEIVAKKRGRCPAIVCRFALPPGGAIFKVERGCKGADPAGSADSVVAAAAGRRDSTSTRVDRADEDRPTRSKTSRKSRSSRARKTTSSKKRESKKRESKKRESKKKIASKKSTTKKTRSKKAESKRSEAVARSSSRRRQDRRSRRVAEEPAPQAELAVARSTRSARSRSKASLAPAPTKPEPVRGLAPPPLLPDDEDPIEIEVPPAAPSKSEPVSTPTVDRAPSSSALARTTVASTRTAPPVRSERPQVAPPPPRPEPVRPRDGRRTRVSCEPAGLDLYVDGQLAVRNCGAESIAYLSPGVRKLTLSGPECAETRPVFTEVARKGRTGPIKVSGRCRLRCVESVRKALASRRTATEGVLACLKRVGGKRPDYVEARLLLAHAYVRSGRAREAERALLDALQTRRGRSDPELRARLAELLGRRRQLERASREAEAAWRYRMKFRGDRAARQRWILNTLKLRAGFFEQLFYAEEEVAFYDKAIATYNDLERTARQSRNRSMVAYAQAARDRVRVQRRRLDGE